MEQRFVFSGYSFETSEEMNEAKKDAEAISYIKAKTDFTNTQAVKTLYAKLTEKESLQTPVGMEFMKALQRKLLQTEHKKEIPPIPVKVAEKKKGADTRNVSAETRQKQRVELYQQKLKNAHMMNFFFGVIIIAMFAIALLGDNSVLSDTESAIQDKYAAWEEDLVAREAAISQKEKEMGIE
ncbi:MAG: hypothetical protein E7256_16140 [Lachnospiraceae bacterium]|nr:hypothetical protein [Lachnospiraceae bacterium]